MSGGGAVADISVLTEADIPGAAFQQPLEVHMLLLLSGGFCVAV